MAPEIFLRRQYTEKSDLWSIGVMLFQMLTGRIPYRGTTVLDLVADIQAHEPYWPEGIKISPDMKDLVKGLLQRNPNLRITWTEFFLHPCLNIVGLDTSTLPDAIAESVRITQVPEDKELTEARETLICMRAELERREQELNAVKEELDTTKKKLALADEVVDEMASRMVLQDNESKEVEKLRAEKLALEARIEELKAQVLLLATNRLAANEQQQRAEEAEARYAETRDKNLELLTRVEALENQLEVYRVALESVAPDAGIDWKNLDWKSFLPFRK